jgi:hypothetical protein
MYLDITKKGKYKRVLLRDSYRKDGKVSHHTIANLSSCPQEEIDAIDFALKHKKHLDRLVDVDEKRERQGLSVGAVLTIHRIADELGIIDALGSSRQGKLALWQVIARVIDQGSRLSATRLAATHAACDVLGLDSFNEDSLYENLKWLSHNQASVEDKLLRDAYPGDPPALYLYDVTSSYLEGEHNFFAAFGYSRDGKKGKMQIVVGLLCDHEGRPLSIEVFAGNTKDTATFAAQMQKVKTRFKAKHVILVGDRGMIKSQQVKDMLGSEFHYITAITKPQIEKLLADGTFDMSLFDQELAEVVDAEEKIRYVLRRNPLRTSEVGMGRIRKLDAVDNFAAKQTQYLKEHPKASPEAAERRVAAYVHKLKAGAMTAIRRDGRALTVVRDADAVAEAGKLDGCYVLKSDVSVAVADKETLHDRYKDLAQVEWAFRTSKTGELELRPVFVHTKESTQGHVFVVMLSYLIVRELARRWEALNVTVEEGIDELDNLCSFDVVVNGKVLCQKIPEPRKSTRKLLDAAGVILPEVLVSRGVNVATRKKLMDNRKKKRG